MSNHIDFYFDIISAYSYIAHKKIEKIKANQKIIFNYKPIFLGGLHNLAGISAPAFNKYKMKNMQNDCELVSKKNNISFLLEPRVDLNHYTQGMSLISYQLLHPVFIAKYIYLLSDLN